MKITFRTIEPQDLTELRSWFTDTELSRRLSYPTDDWFSYVNSGGVAQCWIALQEGATAGSIQADRDDSDTGFIDIAIRPDLRGRGFGTAVLSAFLEGPGKTFKRIEGSIAADNEASLACCRRCKFELMPDPDEDGFIRAIFDFQRKQS